MSLFSFTCYLAMVLIVHKATSHEMPNYHEYSLSQKEWFLHLTLLRIMGRNISFEN